ncbi:MAG: hypothetical protein ACRDD1_00370, partial [Planctomycetia bacterium]
MSAQSVRRRCYDEAAGVERWRGLETAAASFAAADGDVEFQTDGAKWIWRHAERQFPGARGVLDVFHLLEHLAAATRSVYGEGSGAALGWKTVGLLALLSDGWPGACDWIGRWRERCDPEHAEAVVKATEELIGYLAPHVDHLRYCERLAKVKSIGGGAIEGACKYVIGRRLKSTGGRWPPENAVRMGRLRSTHYA